MHPPSPNLRSGSCCTTRRCQPCCGSGWRRGTFINRWPRSLHRVKTVTRLRALNSPCWGKHRCPRNPSQPWMPLNRKFINICAHICVCVCVCGTFLWSFLIASCVPLEAKDGSLRSYLLSYFIFLYIHNLTEAEIYCHSRFFHILTKEVFRWVKIQIQRWSIYSVIRVLPQTPGSYIVLSILCVAHYTLIRLIWFLLIFWYEVWMFFPVPS